MENIVNVNIVKLDVTRKRAFYSRGHTNGKSPISFGSQPYIQKYAAFFLPCYLISMVFNMSSEQTAFILTNASDLNNKQEVVRSRTKF